MRIVNSVGIALASYLFLSGCNGPSNITRFQPFGPNDVPTNLNANLKLLVAQHSLGASRIHVIFQRGAEGKYIRGGSGDPLPVFVLVTPPREVDSFVRDVHRSVALGQMYEFSEELLDRKNQDVAQALAAEVIARTYCAGGRVTKDFDARITDENTNPSTARRVPQIEQILPGSGGTPGWRVRLACSLWAKPE